MPFTVRSKHLSSLCRALPVAAAALLAGVACQTRAAEVVARVAGVDVTVEEVRGYVDALTPQEQAAVAKDPALLSQVVRAYLGRQAVLREALAKKFEQQPTVKAQLDRVRDQAVTELYLESVSRPAEGYPSDAEVQAAYEANKAAFEVPRQFRVSQVYVAVPRGADKATEEKARRKVDEVVKKLKGKGADFAAIARTDSEDRQTSAQGGEIGWLSEAQMIPGIRAATTALAKEAVSDPLRLDDGWHVVKLLDTRPAATRALAEVREALVAQLKAARSRDLRQAYLAKLVEQSAPAINELALSRVVSRTKGP
jgi:peptidylprolyl isomerase